MFQNFSWRGKPIYDIKKWAKDRGERMVPYHAERNVPGFHGQMIKEEYNDKMPESFWSGLVMQGGWFYKEIK